MKPRRLAVYVTALVFAAAGFFAAAGMPAGLRSLVGLGPGSYTLSAGTYTLTVPANRTTTVNHTTTITSTVTTTVPTTTTQPTTTTVPTGEPAPIAGQGYHLAFTDEFTTLDRTVWDNHIWYDDPPNPAWANFQTVSNGILDLSSRRDDLFSGCTSNCYPINTMTTLTSGKSFQYGYFEARMKWTAGDGAWPAFWLIRTDWAQGAGGCPGYAGELDVFEGQGSEPNVFYGTVHKDSACGDDAQNGNNYQPLGIDLTAGFHTYAALWTPTTITWYLDDQPIISAPTYSTDNAPMFLLLQMWSGGWTAGPNASTPDSIDTQVDWVHVWQQ